MNATATKERPILFSGPMVRAILDGRKTQTRRVLKVQPLDVITDKRHTREFDGKRCWFFLQSRDPNRGGVFRCSYGEIGDRLWVRETFSVANERHAPDKHAWLTYAADGTRVEIDGSEIDMRRLRLGKSYPSIYMPRWASRLTLDITDVRVERLQAISEADAEAEGVDAIPEAPAALTHRTSFAGLWDKLNAKRGFPWASNPWVWCINFERAEA